MSIELPKKAKGERPTYFNDRSIDNILSITLALAGEVVVLRERLDTVERLLEQRGALLQSDVDAYRGPPDVLDRREVWRTQFLDVILRPVQQELEGLQEAADAGSYERQVDFVSRN